MEQYVMNPNCLTCGKPAQALILVDGELHKIHLGICFAKLCIVKPDIAERNELGMEFIKEYIKERETLSQR
jgi:hypothetical protein